MATINVGYPAGNYAYNVGAPGDTYIQSSNPAGGTGILNTVEVWMLTQRTIKTGTFSGSSNSWSLRDYTTLANVPTGSKQTFTGLSIAVSTNDILGAYGGGWHYNFPVGTAPVGEGTGDLFHSGAYTYTMFTQYGWGVYATGVTTDTPTVTTQAASSVTETICTGNGTITAGTQPFTERGVCYKSGAGETPTTADTVVHDHTDATGAFTMSVTGLSAGTQYSMRAYAINAIGTGYGSVVTVKTLGTVTTQAASNVCWCGMTGNGNVTNTGVSALTAKGFCFKSGESGDPTTADLKVSITGSSTGAYTTVVGPMEASTSYRVRAYATNTEGMWYGDTVQEATPAAGAQGAQTNNIFGWVT